MAKASRACLVKMRDYIQEHGLARKVYYDEKGAVCLIGAYARACLLEDPFENNTYLPLADEICAPLVKALGLYSIQDIVYLNDYTPDFDPIAFLNQKIEEY